MHLIDEADVPEAMRVMRAHEELLCRLTAKAMAPLTALASGGLDDSEKNAACAQASRAFQILESIDEHLLFWAMVMVLSTGDVAAKAVANATWKAEHPGEAPPMEATLMAVMTDQDGLPISDARKSPHHVWAEEFSSAVFRKAPDEAVTMWQTLYNGDRQAMCLAVFATAELGCTVLHAALTSME